MRSLASVLSVLLVPIACEGAVVYGLASPYNVVDEVYGPSRLFEIGLAGNSLVDLGPVLLNGAPDDFDALAASQEFGLLAFQSTPAGSRLVQIDVGTTTATILSPPLFARDVRGATFTSSGELWVVDASLDQLVQISPITGEEFDVRSLTLNSQPFDLPTTTDLAVRSSGQMILVAANEIYTVDESTGEMSLLLSDTVGEPTPPAAQPPRLVGAAVGFAGSELLYTFDVEGDSTDDLYTYDLEGGFERELLAAALMPGVDAVLGDLALLEQPVVTGDYNSDGVVDTADYVVWRRTIGSTTVLAANGIDSGTSMSLIDQADYDYWVSKFGSIVGEGSRGTNATVVPEPTTLLACFQILLIGAAVGSAHSRRRDNR